MTTESTDATPEAIKLDVPIAEGFFQFHPGDDPTVPIARDAFRDEMSLSSWPDAAGMIDYLFQLDDFRERWTAAKLPQSILEEQRKWGIVAGMTTIDDSSEALDLLDQSDGSLYACVRLNPHDGMRAVRRLEELKRNHPSLKGWSLAAHMSYPQVTLNSKELYPLYAKCVELDLAVYANVGIPGPRVPGECQNPIYLDEVCWFFPELRVIMKHGGEPWVDTCIKLMLKWPNLYYATSAFAPKHYPKAIVDFLNTRGRDRVLYAGYWPMMSYSDVLGQIAQLPIRSKSLRPFLYDNFFEAFKIPTPA